MPPSRPFVDPEDGTVHVEQVLAEAIPLARLIGAFVLVALVPYAIAFLLGPGSGLAVVLAIAGQFVLAVGTGIALMYVVARAMALVDGG